MNNRSIVKQIYTHSQETPSKTAIIATDYTVDYRSLWNAITTVNHYLKLNGYKPGDRIMLEADHTVVVVVGRAP